MLSHEFRNGDQGVRYAASSCAGDDRLYKGILETCSKIGGSVRGAYGENTEASGNMFQISNQVTLGQTEEEIVQVLAV